MPMLTLALIALTGCEALEPFLWEVRQPATEVSFAGSVLASAFDFEAPFSGGTMEWTAPDGQPFTDEDGRELVDAEGQPLGLGVEVDPDGSPGYWSVVLPAGAPYVLRADGDGDGDGYYPALYSGVSPDGNGLWFTGALFGWPAELTDPYLEDTAAQIGLSLSPLSGGGVSHLWGSVHPDVVDTLEPGRLALIDGSGAAVDVVGWRIESDGSWSLAAEPPLDYFMAYNLTPGEITLTYDGRDGLVETTWADVRGGEVITPWYYLAD